MQQWRTKAIVLRRTNYGEADRVLNLLTPERGKVSAIAKGVRKPKSKLAGGLELLAVCDVTIAESKRGMGLVTSARIDQFFGDILQGYERLELAYTMIKEINRAAATVSEPEFFYLLRDGFAYVNTKDIEVTLVELWFRLQQLALLGRALNVVTDREGNKLAAGKQYQYDFTENALYEDPGGRFGAGHIKLLRLATTKNPAVLRQVSGIGAVLDDCVWLVRTVES